MKWVCPWAESPLETVQTLGSAQAGVGNRHEVDCHKRAAGRIHGARLEVRWGRAFMPLRRVTQCGRAVTMLSGGLGRRDRLTSDEGR